MIPTNICGLSEQTQSKLISLFQTYSNIKKVILYGSRAKGNFRPGSDIDLTVDAPNMNLSEILRVENSIDDLLLPYKVDLSLLHQIDNEALIEHIKRVGIVFYERYKS